MNALRRIPWFRSLPCLAWVAVSSVSGQDSWRSTLYPSDWQAPDAGRSFATEKMIQDFSYAGYRRGEVNLPTISGPVFDVVQYGADPTGASDSTVAIQNAINAAAVGGGVVFLPAGEFRISPQGSNNYCLRIASSNMVIRGAGATQTFLLNTSYRMNGKSVIQVSPSSTSTGTARNITANLPGPTRRIPVENAETFTPGNIVRLQWNFTTEWVAENNQETWWADSRPGSATYLREVLATDPVAGWIELDVPTRYWIKTRDLPTVRTVSGLIRNIGLESFSIGNLQHPGSGWGENDYTDETKAAFDTHASWLVRLGNVRDSWISNVHSRQASANSSTCHMLSNGILLGSCMRITVNDCQMRRPQYGGGGGNGYMYRVQSSNECLVRNCIADFSRHGFVISHGGTSGNVFLQCEDRETKRATGSTASGYTTSGSGSDNHQYFSHSNLWDQCHAHNSFFTASHRTFNGTIPHGVTSAHGVYWNTSGSGTRYADSSNPIVRSEQLNYGYIIGTHATSGTSYQASIPTGGNTAPADHREGVGLGATLQPASLYLDQLSRRLRPIVTLHANGGTSPVPGSVQVIFGGSYGSLPNPSRAGFSFTGWYSDVLGGSRIDAETPVTNSANHSIYAHWNALPSVDSGPDRWIASTLPRPWSPERMPTAAWYDAADPATISSENGAVSVWQDKSGNHHHAAQSTLSRRPLATGATIGGRNTVAFDAYQDQHLSAPHHDSLDLDGTGGANLFAVFNSSGYVSRTSGLNSIVSKGSLVSAGASYGIRLSSNNLLPFKAGDNFFATPADPMVSQDVLYGGIRDDSGKTAGLFINGLVRASSTTTPISSNNTSPLILGGETTTARCANVRLGELLIIPGAMAEARRQEIEGYLAHKWSLQSKLPAGHRFKSSPPTHVATAIIAGAVADAENDPVDTLWSMVSGPGQASFDDVRSPATTASFPSAGTYLLRCTATDALGSRSDDVVVTVLAHVPEDAFVQWAAADVATFTADSNADGLADGLAWLLGAGTPQTSASGLLPTLLRDVGGPLFTFQYLAPSERAAYSMRLQYSHTLAPASWNEVPIPDASGTSGGVVFHITPSPDGRLHRVEARVPIGHAGVLFLRLATSLP